jgi:DNA-binding MarR family transcriptional regulator
MSAPPQAAPRPEALDALGHSLKMMLVASRRLRGRDTHRVDHLSHAQYSLLFSLADEPELSSSQLARNADLTQATVTQMLDGLKDGGLITRRRAEHDRRVVLTALSEHGATVVAQRRARIEPRWRAALEDFDEHELRTAAAVMERIGGFFDTLHDDT